MSLPKTSGTLLGNLLKNNWFGKKVVVMKMKCPKHRWSLVNKTFVAWLRQYRRVNRFHSLKTIAGQFQIWLGTWAAIVDCHTPHWLLLHYFSSFRLRLFWCKILFYGWKYFRERKIFSNVLLHFKNYIRKQFSVFGNILKMLFSYKFVTFSQLPNKFYITKSTITHKKSITIHTKPTTTQQKNH